MGPPDSDRISRVPPYSGYHYGRFDCRVRDCHSLWSFFPKRSSNRTKSNGVVLQPREGRDLHGLGSSPFARHYWGNHCYFLFLRVLRCFNSPRSLRYTVTNISISWVAPFRNSRIKAPWRLPETYRSLARLSSPLLAKASTTCSL